MTHFSEETKVYFRDFDPDASDTLTNAGVSTSWIDMRDYHRLTVLAFRTAGTGVVQAASIVCSSVSTGLSDVATVTSVGSTSAGGLLNAAGAGNSNAGVGLIVLDATADEIAAVNSDARYVAARMSLATGTDEFGIAYILSEPRYAASGLTASGSSS